MASSSSFSVRSLMKYDVFLSFRGVDTRDNFTSHLYAALCGQKIDTFIDNELVRGEEISPSLLNAIEQSRISIIVFSEGYASSRWCLDELVKILDCREKYGQNVVPVFYHIDPSDVRNQTGAFADAFIEHEERFKERLEDLQRWRNVLMEAANLSGFDSSVIRPESELVKKIVQDIVKRLNYMFVCENKEIVGIEGSIIEIEMMLRVESKDVCAVGIWGIGGVGKTTIASIIFNKFSSKFEGSYFAQNIREESENPNGLIHLQKEFLSTILKDSSLCIGPPNIRNAFIDERLRRTEVLVVLDDVTCLDQVRVLIGDFKIFHKNSRFIITTRNKHVLENCGVHKIHEVLGLSYHDSLQLFSRHAFGQDYPIEGYMQLSKRVIINAKGVPLALKVLGSFLQGRGTEDWESAIDKLENSLHEDIFKVLKISYDGLDHNEKEIFKDIACFLKLWDRDVIEDILEASGFSARIGISVLIEKSLITVMHDKITMHDLLEEMGKKIVEQESKDHGKRSRLWHHKNISHLLTKNKGTEAIEGISLDMSRIEDIHLTPQAFMKMDNLRFFNLYSSSNKVQALQGLEFVTTELTYFCWLRCPMKSLPSNFLAEKIVVLNMCYSNVEQLWNNVQHVVNLKHMYLSHCKHLKSIPDLSSAQNLESLILNGCTSLFEINTSPSIEFSNKLVNLDLRECKSLICLPTGLQSKSLTSANLSGCSNLQMVSMISSTSVERLYFNGTSIKALPLNIEYPSRLVELNLQNCSRLESLPSSICKLKSLENLILFGCSKLQRLPENLENLEALTFLDISYCVRLQSLPKLPGVLDLQAYNCLSLESLSDLSFILSPTLRLQKVNFANCFKIDRNLRDKLKDALLKYPHKEIYGASSSAICFPGDEIPEWFSFQNVGSSITLELLPGDGTNEIVGFVLCAVTAFPICDNRDLKDFYVRCTCIVSANGGWMEQSIFLWGASVGADYFKSDHIFLGYDFLTSCILDDHFANKVSIKFHVDYPHFEVKNCGVHLLYVQDCGELPMGESGRCSNLDEMEEGKQPDPKRLKILEFL